MFQETLTQKAKRLIITVKLMRLNGGHNLPPALMSHGKKQDVKVILAANPGAHKTDLSTIDGISNLK